MGWEGQVKEREISASEVPKPVDGPGGICSPEVVSSLPGVLTSEAVPFQRAVM
jgi:hypothetical protein